MDTTKFGLILQAMNFTGVMRFLQVSMRLLQVSKGNSYLLLPNQITVFVTTIYDLKLG